MKTEIETKLDLELKFKTELDLEKSIKESGEKLVASFAAEQLAQLNALKEMLNSPTNPMALYVAEQSAQLDASIKAFDTRIHDALIIALDKLNVNYPITAAFAEPPASVASAPLSSAAPVVAAPVTETVRVLDVTSSAHKL